MPACFPLLAFLSHILIWPSVDQDITCILFISGVSIGATGARDRRRCGLVEPCQSALGSGTRRTGAKAATVSLAMLGHPYTIAYDRDIFIPLPWRSVRRGCLMRTSVPSRYGSSSVSGMRCIPLPYWTCVWGGGAGLHAGDSEGGPSCQQWRCSWWRQLSWMCC